MRFFFITIFCFYYANSALYAQEAAIDFSSLAPSQQAILAKELELLRIKARDNPGDLPSLDSEAIRTMEVPDGRVTSLTIEQMEVYDYLYQLQQKKGDGTTLPALDEFNFFPAKLRGGFVYAGQPELQQAADPDETASAVAMEVEENCGADATAADCEILREFAKALDFDNNATIEEITAALRDDPENATCSEAIKDLRKAQKACNVAAGGYCKIKNYRKSKNAFEHVKKFLIAASDYDDACLQSPVPYKRAGGAVSADDMPTVIEDTAAKRVGVLAKGNSAPFCGAYLIDDRRIVTARHCFYDYVPKKGARPAKFSRNDLAYEYAEIQFLIASGDTAYAFPITKPVLSNRDAPEIFEVGDDFMIIPLNLDNVSDVDPRHVLLSTLPDVSVRAPRPGEQLFVLGHYFWHDRKRMSVLTGDIQSACKTYDWYCGVRWAMPKSCFALKANNKCMVHSCQTDGGFSGTPIFAFTDDGSTELVGVQHGYQDFSGNGLPKTCGGETLRQEIYSGMNLAVRIHNNVQ